MATLAEARSELQDRIGADLTDDEADRLLNEGNGELCTRSEWTRATLELGPTVIDQANYTLPASVYRPLKVKVNGRPYLPVDEETVDEIVAGTYRLRARGVWWLDHDEDGVETFSLYPTPGTADLTILALCVVTPATLTANDSFPVPDDFHQAPVYFAASRSLGGSEDDLEARSYWVSEFENFVARLRRLRVSRVGRGPRQMGIIGVNR